MKMTYEAPELFVDEYVADTMIASSGEDLSGAKNGNGANNPNCWGCRYGAHQLDPNNKEDVCMYTPGDGVYEEIC